MAICPMCAEDVAASDAECPHCGNLLVAAPTSPQVQGVPVPRVEVRTRRGEAPTPGTWKRTRQYFLPMLLGVLLAAALATKFSMSHRALDQDVLPRGAGWWCDEGLDTCARTREECDPSGIGVLNGSERMCQRREVAWCFTYERTGERRARWACKVEEQRCDEARAGYSRISEVSHLSACTRVGDIQTIAAQATTLADVPPSTPPSPPSAAHLPTQTDSETIPVGDSPIIGPRTALVTIVEFGDFQCPFCARVEDTLRRLRAHFGDDLRIVWKNNPLPMHDDAQLAAEAAIEAHSQGGNAGFWRFHDLVFEHREHLARPDLERYAQILGLNMTRFRQALDTHAHRDEVTRDQQLASYLHASGTPTFFINGTKVTGAQPYERFEQFVDSVLARARTIQPPTSAYATMVTAPLPSPDPPPTAPNAAPSPTPSAEHLQRLTPTSISASSFIANRRNQHTPERAFDGDPATAWNENDRGPGDGAWIEATFSGRVTVRRVTLTTGYDSISPRHGDLFPLNSHLRRVRISFDGGHVVEREVGEAQRTLVLDGLETHTHALRIEAVRVWAGTRWADFCISEITIEGDDAR